MLTIKLEDFNHFNLFNNDENLWQWFVGAKGPAWKNNCERKLWGQGGSYNLDNDNDNNNDNNNDNDKDNDNDNLDSLRKRSHRVFFKWG